MTAVSHGFLFAHLPHLGPSRAYDPSRWTAFFTGLLTATAALTGLLFVAIANNLKSIVKDSHLVGRAADTLGVLLALLLISALALVPQSTRAIGIEVIVVAVVLVVLTSRGQAQTILAHDPSHQRVWHVSRVLATAPAGIAAVCGGVSLIITSAGGFFWIMAAELIGVCGATVSAWVLMIEILR